MARLTLRRKSRATAADEEPLKVEEEVEVHVPEEANEDAEIQKDEQMHVTEEPTASTPSTTTKGNFVLVMDNGQLALVPATKAHTYRSLPKRGQKVEEEVGTTSQLSKGKKLQGRLRGSEMSSSPRIRVKEVKRGRGRPPKKRSRSQLLEFEFEEEEEREEDEGEREEEEEEEENEEEAVDTPTEEVDIPADEEDDNLVPAPFEMNVYVQGKDYLLKNDELVLDKDEEGDKKVDEKGNLLGGREYNFRTFTSNHRADTEVQYALSIDAARGAGYRDSLYFFRKNPLLIKLSCTDREKVTLIEEGRLGGQLRSRNVTMLAVRNVYKTHGAKIIKNGTFIVDDYYEKEARETGQKEVGNQTVGEERSASVAPKPVEKRRDADRDRDRARRRPDAYTFSTADVHGNAIYTTFGDGGSSPFERAKGWNARRVNLQRADIDEENWMIEMARSVRGMNHEILLSRNERLKAFARPYETSEGRGKDGDQGLLDENDEDGLKRDNSQGLPIGFFEPMTNMPHYSSSTQPTWASLERVYERPLSKTSKDVNSGGSKGPAILGNAKVGSQGWGLASIDQRVVLPSPPVRGVTVPARASLAEEEN
jgi:chromatin structure-remodeling complex protein RSC7